MNYVDIFISSFLLYGFVRGLFKGFISEIASVLGLVLGIYLATQYNGDLSNYLISKQFLSWKEGYIIILSNIILFGGVYWSKFAHMFYKPGAALQKNLSEEDGSRDWLPEASSKPKKFGLGIKRESARHY